MTEGKIFIRLLLAQLFIWCRMLGYKEVSCPEDECSKDGMLRRMCGNTKRNKMRNEDIAKIGITHAEEKMRESHMMV